MTKVRARLEKAPARTTSLREPRDRAIARVRQIATLAPPRFYVGGYYVRITFRTPDFVGFYVDAHTISREAWDAGRGDARAESWAWARGVSIERVPSVSGSWT